MKLTYAPPAPMRPYAPAATLIGGCIVGDKGKRRFSGVRLLLYAYIIFDIPRLVSILISNKTFYTPPFNII
jgi:hypothetical protein